MRKRKPLPSHSFLTSNVGDSSGLHISSCMLDGFPHGQQRARSRHAPLEAGYLRSSRATVQRRVKCGNRELLGGKSSIGASQGECTIKALTRKGNVFTINDVCRDIQSGDVIAGGPTVITVAGPATFRMSGVSYRYCGTRVQF